MIYICVPYFNESLIAEIQVENDKSWVQELHICESDYTFKYGYKDYNFPENLKKNNIVKYHKMNAKHIFVPNNKLGKMKLISYRLSKDNYRHGLASPAWYNESKQRNAAVSYISPKDDDFVILCDIDEIIDPRFIDRILSETRKYGIVTCKLHFTMFYFDLYVQGWGGPPDYSYRLFSMTGKYFNELIYSSDELRKRGERKIALDEIYCIDDFCGFHHSWLGDKNMIYTKMRAYAHSLEEHTESSEEFIEMCVKNGKSLFTGVSLIQDSNISLIPAVEKLRHKYSNLFFRN